MYNDIIGAGAQDRSGEAPDRLTASNFGWQEQNGYMQQHYSWSDGAPERHWSCTSAHTTFCPITPTALLVVGGYKYRPN
jgi:hypothetical protein